MVIPQGELNMACLRTAVKLLERLELKPLDASSTGDDSVHVVSRLFNKYSVILLEGLEHCRLDVPVSGPPFKPSRSLLIDSQTPDNISEAGSIQQVIFSSSVYSECLLIVSQRMRLSQREAEIRELVITGLGHLVMANAECGFKQCLPLAYHEDHRKRTIFAHVFARVIGQGTKFDAADPSVVLSRHSRLNQVFSAFKISMRAG